MNREEKETLFAFLDASRRYLSAGTARTCAMPDFCDDTVADDTVADDTVAGDTVAGDTVAGDTVPRDAGGKLAAIENRPYAGNAGIRDIAAEIAGCRSCPLAETRTNAVPGVGPDAPLALVVGEAPGADEDAKGEPFVGKAGHLLDKMLDAIGLSRATNCYIANVVKCRPPQNRDPSPDEEAACARFLDAQIDALRPVAILAVGRVAAQRLLDTTVGIGQLRGATREYRGIPLVATFHPSALLRDETLKRPAWEDLKKFRALLDELRAGGGRS